MAPRWLCWLLVGACASEEPPSVRPAAESVSVIVVASTPTHDASVAPPAAPPLMTHPDLAPWVDRAAELRLQVLIREVRGEALVPSRFRVDADYVYPASAIKTFASVAALNALRDHGADRNAHPLRSTIEAVQVRSDNVAFARLFNIVGHRDLNQTLWDLGFTSIRMHHRMGETKQQGLRTPAVTVPLGDTTWAIPARESALSLPPTSAPRLDLGAAHLTPTGKRVDTPMSFADKNHVSLEDLQLLNLALVLPGRGRDLGLHPDDRALLLQLMSRDDGGAQQRPLLGGVERALEGRPVRYVGKSGRAYGFHVANAYIQGPGGAVFVTAAIYANPNGVLNDDNYDYDGTTGPFMTALGAVVANAFLQP